MPMSPEAYSKALQSHLIDTINLRATGLYGAVVKATPVGVGGRLQRSWTLSPATVANPTASIGTNSQYFLPLEMGREPGSGISQEGQDSVALWATRKLGLSAPEAKGFAYLLSRKYQREGRPALGLLGLAPPGSQGMKVPDNLADTVPGSLLHNAYKALQSDMAKPKFNNL